MRRAVVAPKPHYRNCNDHAGANSSCEETSGSPMQARQQQRRKRKHGTLFGATAIRMIRRFLAVFILVTVAATLVVIDTFGVSLAQQKTWLGPHLRSSTAGTSKIQENRSPTVFERYTLAAPECIHIAPDDVAFTLVTQLSMDRLWMMKYHCERWGSTSPMSVAVLTNQTELQTRNTLIDLGCHHETLSMQTMHLTEELKADYPVNKLRRMALAAVRTSHVMYVDIDFWESVDLHDILHQAGVREALAADSKRVVVVPAFQLNRQCREYRECPDENIPKMPQTWQDMIHTMQERRAFPFDPTNRGGHGSTLYAQWIKQEAGELLDIPCIQSNRYEPYIAFRYCRTLPPFQTMFSGYGKNKMTWVMQLRREGYLFSQVGGAFVVHYPHLDSASRMEWNHGPEEIQPFRGADGKMHKKQPVDIKLTDWVNYKRGQVDAVFITFRTWLQSEVEDTSRVQMCEDREDDDSRLWIDRSQTE
jgi:hypothetical protein